jgi:beta-glucosidase-like glycosyl hydrolase/CubicO group peptidase (beta-lactamase class C family)
VSNTLGRLTLAEKAAQMVGVRLGGLTRDPASPEAARARARALLAKPGSVVVFDADPATLRDHLDRLQKESKVPVLVAADMERGLSFRVHHGVVPLPFAMAVGATRSEDAARFMGEVSAREGRALGIQWAFAPVADVNNNPANPVINIRSFGEDPDLVARLSAAFVAGARSGGLLTTAKHFPGHGDTTVDSHLRLATLAGDRKRLDAVELRPFRAAVEAGVDWVMLGHIAAPALDSTGTPATLSAPMVETLRRDLGFRGLLVTDGMDMAGVDPAWNREAAVRAVEAGADLILLPPDPEGAVRSLVRAVEDGRLSRERLDTSVRRILEVKARLHLQEPERSGEPEGGGETSKLERPADVEKALDIARASITVVRNEGGVLPLSPRRVRLLHLVLSSDEKNPAIRGIPEAELRARGVNVVSVLLGPDLGPEAAAAIVERSRGFTHVVASCFVRVMGRKGTADMVGSHARLLRDLAAAGRPLVVVSFASPYLLRQFPQAGVYVAAYGPAESSQRAAIGALFGEFPVAGKLPVTLPGLYPYGHGLSLGASAVTVDKTPPQASPRPEAREDFSAADEVVAGAVSARAFPGGVLAIGRDGDPPRVRAFGRLTYEPGAPAVTPDTVYDLASLTKIVATTTATMLLVDAGRLDLDKPVSAYVPAFRGGAHDQVRVANLLTHSSGLPARRLFYTDLSGWDAVVQAICASDLEYAPGTQSVYSDLDMMLLGAVVERAAGEPFGGFVERRILRPLGMASTGFKPGAGILPRIAPTEVDPWRGRLLRGEVHDENAFAMGGIAGHAGLFGPATDLARFAGMLVRGGQVDGKPFVTAATLARFTRRAGIPGSTYGLGFDTATSADDAPRSSVPGEAGYSSSGSLFSPRAFGHTGFTGTSMWVDPERRLYVILLTNRVHPDRNNNAIRAVRSQVADAVVRALR